MRWGGPIAVIAVLGAAGVGLHKCDKEMEAQRSRLVMEVITCTHLGEKIGWVYVKPHRHLSLLGKWGTTILDADGNTVMEFSSGTPCGRTITEQLNE